MQETESNPWMAGLATFVVWTGGGGGGGGIASAQDCYLDELPDAPVFPGPHQETLELRMIAHQGKFAQELDWWDSSMPSDPWAAHGVHNHAIMVPGSALLAAATIGVGGAPTPMTPYLFVLQTVPDIKTQLEGWVADVEAGPWFDPETFTGFVILDIEHPIRPVHFRTWFNDALGAMPDTHHPIEGHEQYDEDSLGNPILLDQMIEGFSRRIRAARQVFPFAKLAVYPMVHTPSDGVCRNSLEKNIKAWEYASQLAQDVPRPDSVNGEFDRQSWLDDLDYVCVQLYPRFAPCDDTPTLSVHNETTTRAFVSLGLEVAKRIADMESGVGVLPMLAFAIHNPNEESAYEGEEGSCENDFAATIDYVTWQLLELREYAFVGAPGQTIADMPICFWDGDGVLAASDKIRDAPEPQTIAEFMDDLFFSICDLNGIPFVFHPGGAVTVQDDSDFFLQAIDDAGDPPTNPFHMVFDTNGDRYVTTAGTGNDEDTYLTAPCHGP